MQGGLVLHTIIIPAALSLLESRCCEVLQLVVKFHTEIELLLHMLGTGCDRGRAWTAGVVASFTVNTILVLFSVAWLLWWLWWIPTILLPVLAVALRLLVKTLLVTPTSSHILIIPASLSLPPMRGAAIGRSLIILQSDSFFTRISNFVKSPFLSTSESRVLIEN